MKKPIQTGLLVFYTAFTCALGYGVWQNAQADQPASGFDGGSSGAPTNADFWVGTANGSLSAEIIPSGGTGITVVPTTGVISVNSSVAFNNAGNSFSVAQIPSALGSIDLGSTTKAWRSLYLSPNGGSNYAVITPTTLTGNRTVNVPDANSTTVQANTGAATNFLTSISAQGVVARAQPTFTDISGTATATQGGTGVNGGAAANGSLLIGNGSGYSLATLTQGSGVTITNGSGTITIAATGGGFTLSAQAGNYTATNGATYYRNSSTGNITLPASPNDGSVRKFVQTSGTGTFVFNGAETVRHANGTSDQALTQSSTSGAIELTARSGGWDET